MNDTVLSALDAIDPKNLTYLEWILIGMALKSEGFSSDIWDAWSRKDPMRYHDGECRRRWISFARGGTGVVKGGTIIRIAKDKGWTCPPKAPRCLEWNDNLDCHDQEESSNRLQSVPATPTEELIKYLETLHDSDDKVNIVTNDVYQRENDGKWVPRRGYIQTVGVIIKKLKKYTDDVGAAVGDWNPEAGAWISINALDGDGIKSANVVKYKYALIESDTMSLKEQYDIIKTLQLPVATLVFSGGKSLHALVKVDAADASEYKKRVKYLYDYLEEKEFDVDRQDGNCSRRSRMPGVTRSGKRQCLLETNIGAKSWDEWIALKDAVSGDLPGIVSLGVFKDNVPDLPQELIQGILRCGHKMLISGPSKAGKSFLLIQLCVSIAEGVPWLGFACKQGKVLYVNLEIDPASVINRFFDIYEAMKISKDNLNNVDVWNLRGHAVPLDKLAPELIRRARDRHYDAIIIDPIYKIITGDENNASEMGAFCNLFDNICTELGCAVIYCHHHSKGAQGAKKAMDRASGSGVFARDPDAQLDIIRLEFTPELQKKYKGDSITAWRIESNLREFENIIPVNCWFEHPVHRLDEAGELDACYSEGSFQAARQKNRKYTTPEDRKSSIEEAFDACSKVKEPVTLLDMANYLNITDRCVRDRLKELNKTFWVKNTVVGKIKKTEN